MTLFRRTAGRIALAWLLSQAASVVLVPVLFVASEAGELECTCSHGDHAMCPMHHGNRPSKTGCAMRGAADPVIAVIPGLLGTVGLIPHSAIQPLPEYSRLAFLTSSDRIALDRTPPDAPPPRG